MANSQRIHRHVTVLNRTTFPDNYEIHNYEIL
jgi:hypothetical protein